MITLHSRKYAKKIVMLIRWPTPHIREYEKAYVDVNGATCWTKSGIHYSTGDQACGRTTSSNRQYKEQAFSVTGCTATLSGPGKRPLVVRVRTSLNSGAFDESFGIDNVVIKRITPGMYLLQLQ